jgi:hypothetical protein
MKSRLRFDAVEEAEGMGLKGQAQLGGVHHHSAKQTLGERIGLKRGRLG